MIENILDNIIEIADVISTNTLDAMVYIFASLIYIFWIVFTIIFLDNHKESIDKLFPSKDIHSQEIQPWGIIIFIILWLLSLSLPILGFYGLIKVLFDVEYNIWHYISMILGFFGIALLRWITGIFDNILKFFPQKMNDKNKLKNFFKTELKEIIKSKAKLFGSIFIIIISFAFFHSMKLIQNYIKDDVDDIQKPLLFLIFYFILVIVFFIRFIKFIYDNWSLIISTLKKYSNYLIYFAIIVSLSMIIMLGMSLET